MSQWRKQLGRKGEERAVNYLKLLDFKILSLNKRYSLGEIDILAQDRETIVLVEVKTGITGKFGLAIERVGSQKQHKLRLLASRVSQDYPNHSLRIDIINVTPEGEILYWKNAIEAV